MLTTILIMLLIGMIPLGVIVAASEIAAGRAVRQPGKFATNISQSTIMSQYED